MKGGPSVAILHYSCPPVIGGVEFVIEAHARLFAEAGHPVRLLVGKGGRVHTAVRTVVLPELASDGGPHAAVVKALARGRVPRTYDAAAAATAAALRRALRGVDVCMMHNVLTMHFNLVLTAALARVMAAEGARIHFVGWTHDMTWCEPVYEAQQRDRHPWTLMRTPLEGCHYCAISETRRRQLCRLLGLPAAQVPVIPDGIDVPRKLGLTPMAESCYREERLPRVDVVALTPARVLRRKNLEAGVEIVAALKRRGLDVRWFITGAPDPHNPEMMRYYRELLALRNRLGIRREIVFLGERFDRPVSDADLLGFFNLADVLLFPSHREGFGLPILEAGLARMLCVLSDIPVFRELAGSDAVLIRKGMKADTVAERLVRRLKQRPGIQYRKHVMAGYSWLEVFDRHVRPAATAPRTLWPRPRA